MWTFEKSHYIVFFAEKRIAEIDAKIDANISADGKGIYIHPTFVICWVECRLVYEVYRRLARHSPRAEANIVKACNTMQWSHKIS